MNWTERWTIGGDYLRASTWRMRGVGLASKVRIGRRCELVGSGDLQIGTRSVVEPDVAFKLVSATARLQIGAHGFVGRGSIFDIEGELRIGDHCLIAPGVFITDHNHGIAATGLIWQQACRTAAVTIGNDVWLGAKVVVLPGVTIGDGAVVAAGAIVTRDVEAMTVVAGNPARLLRQRT